MTPNRRQILQTAAAATWVACGLADGADPPRRRIKIGQIGVGHAHATKLSVYRSSDDYEIVGIVEPNETRRKRVAEQGAYRDLPWMTREQLLSTPGLEAVLVETEVQDLLDNAEAAVAAGKHVHLDKPAGADLPQYERLLAAAEKQQLLVQMGYMYRYSPAVVLLREFLRQGWLGDIFEVHTVMSKVVGAGERRNLAEFPGGMMFELGGHIMDLVIGVLGAPDQVTPFLQHASALNDSLADNTLAVLSYPRAIASVKSSAQEVDGGARRHFVVCGSKGTFQIQPLDNPAAHVTLSEPRGEYRRGAQDVTFPRFQRYVGDAADMARILRGEKEADFSYAHDLAVQRSLLQACGMT